MAFEPGEVVQLKSGSPALTVVAVEGSHASVVWYSDDIAEFRTHTIPTIALETLDLTEFDDDDDDDDSDADDSDADED
ncbi:YodC family protein [Xanthobacter sp. TB0139]|uniref:YodC family protein n=1 Tax=Xanthobacter sp. TB0139 TaxID=3459178 RepID=UPI004039EB58